MDKIALVFQSLKITLPNDILGFIGGLTPQLKILLNLIAADTMLYLFLLLRKQGLPPGASRGFFGYIFRKAACLVLIGLAQSIDALSHGLTSPVYNIVMYYFISFEGMCIIGLCGELGLPVPDKLLTSVKALAKSGGAQNEAAADSADGGSAENKANNGAVAYADSCDEDFGVTGSGGAGENADIGGAGETAAFLPDVWFEYLALCDVGNGPGKYIPVERKRHARDRKNRPK